MHEVDDDIDVKVVRPWAETEVPVLTCGVLLFAPCTNSTGKLRKKLT